MLAAFCAGTLQLPTASAHACGLECPVSYARKRKDSQLSPKLMRPGYNACIAPMRFYMAVVRDASRVAHIMPCAGRKQTWHCGKRERAAAAVQSMMPYIPWFHSVIGLKRGRKGCKCEGRLLLPFSDHFAGSGAAVVRLERREHGGRNGAVYIFNTSTGCLEGKWFPGKVGAWWWTLPPARRACSVWTHAC